MMLSPTALAQYDRPKLMTLLRRAYEQIQALESEVGQLRQQITWRDQLDAVPATVMSQNQKAALKVTLQDIQHKAPDADGLVQIASWHLCKKAGMSKGTFLDHLAYCADLGILCKRTEQVRDPDSQQVIATNYYVGTTELTAYPSKYQALSRAFMAARAPAAKILPVGVNGSRSAPSSAPSSPAWTVAKCKVMRLTIRPSCRVTTWISNLTTRLLQTLRTLPTSPRLWWWKVPERLQRGIKRRAGTSS